MSLVREHFSSLCPKAHPIETSQYYLVLDLRPHHGGKGSLAILTVRLTFADLPAEVVVAPTAVHIPLVQSSLRKDFAIAAQNAWVKGSGAYTGELR